VDLEDKRPVILDVHKACIKQGWQTDTKLGEEYRLEEPKLDGLIRGFFEFRQVHD
jgi:hypothetical protein